MIVTPDPIPYPVSSRPRYELLDGLRGVAALLVICYHFGEGFATSAIDQAFNHGYLAVDFFFVLSGFVIGYAYDDRWKRGMTSWRFMLRRVIRLQPMVVFAILFGTLAFLLQGSVKWDGTSVEWHHIIGAVLLGLFMIPTLPSAGVDVRGNGEMFPLNGPSWSLFFEYIGSIMYAFFLHRLSRRALRWFVAISAIGLGACAIGNMSGTYHLGVGWSMADGGFIGGFFRLSFSFGAGLLLSREFRPRRVKGAFWICAVLLAALLSMPYVGGDEPSVANAIYDLTATLLIFPAIVWLGACGTTTDRSSTAICNFLGEISYPVYIVHYPLMYLLYAWVWGNSLTFDSVWWVCVLMFLGIILLAWAVMRFYDAPVRRWLSAKMLHR